MARTYVVKNTPGETSTYTFPAGSTARYIQATGAGGSGTDGTSPMGMDAPGNGGGGAASAKTAVTGDSWDYYVGLPHAGANGDLSYVAAAGTGMPAINGECIAAGGKINGVAGSSADCTGDYKVSGGTGVDTGGSGTDGGGGGGAGDTYPVDGNESFTEAGHNASGATGGAASFLGNGAGGNGGGSVGGNPGGGGGGGNAGITTGGLAGAGQVVFSYISAGAFPPCIVAQQNIRNRGTLSMWDLRQSTASQEIPLGPFVDSTDGDTAETGLTIANTDIKLFKTGATAAVSKNSGGATHDAAGVYYAVLDATDTNTIGPLAINVHVAGALAVTLYCRVLDEAIFDQLYGTSAIGGLDAAGVRTAVGLASANLDTQLSTIDDFLDTEVAAIKAKTDQFVFTVANQVDANALTGGSGLDAAGVRAAIGLASANLDTQLGTIDDLRDTEVATLVSGVANIQTRLPAALTSNGNMKSSLLEILATAITETVGGYLSAGFKKFFDVVTPTSTMNRITLVDTVTDLTNQAVTCECDISVRTTAGNDADFVAWLEISGNPVVLATGTATITLREKGAGSDLWSVTSSSPNADGVFAMSKNTPGFTSDRIYVAKVEIEDEDEVLHTTYHTFKPIG